MHVVSLTIAFTNPSEGVITTHNTGELSKWSQLICTFLKGNRKVSHLLGTGPSRGDPWFDGWDEQDSMIMAWLWNSMTPEISDTCMFLTIVEDI